MISKMSWKFFIQKKQRQKQKTITFLKLVNLSNLWKGKFDFEIHWKGCKNKGGSLH